MDDRPAVAPSGTPGAAPVEGWLVKLLNFGPPANAGVSAVCAGGAAADVAVRTAAQVVNPTAFSFDGKTLRLEERDFFTPCAAGEKAIAGGWSSTQPGPFAPNVLAVEDQPAGPENFQGEAWNIRLQNFSTEQALATTYALCAKGATAASIVLRRSEGMLPPDFVAHDFYSGCVHGEHVVSGGWAAEPAANGLVFSLDDNPTGTENFGVETWHVKLFYFFIDHPIRVSVFAFCMR